jgi:F-type H+-transporting ATPase subunit b
MTELLSSTSVWVLISFITFLILAYKFGRHSLLSSLDGRIEKIKKDIAQAEALRVEAQELLAQYQRKSRDAGLEAQQMIERAKNQAIQFQKQADDEFIATMKKREEMLQERLFRMEEMAKDEIRLYAAELAITATTQIITEKMTMDQSSRLIGQSISTVSERLN